MKRLELDYREESLLEDRCKVGAYKNSTEYVLYCKSCNTNKLRVVQQVYDTYVVCPKCNLSQIIGGE